MSKFVQLVLSLLAFICAAVPVASAQSSKERNGTYVIGAPVLPYGKFPFPNVVDGEIWIPDLSWKSETTIVYNSFKEQDGVHRPKTELTFDEYKKQGRLKEILSIYDRHSKTSPWGVVELDIGRAYHYGQGGLKKSETKALEWYKKGALEKPIIYYLMGEIYRTSKDAAIQNHKLAAHYYSKGAARGCGRCGQRMIHMIAENEKYPSVTFSKDARLRYQVYLYALGVGYGDKWLRDFLDAFPKSPETIAFNKEIFGSRSPPYLSTGLFAKKLNRRIRSGFAPSGCLRAKKQIDAGELVKALGTMVSRYWGCHGRFRGQLLSRLIVADSRSTTPKMKGANPFYLGQEALNAGEMSFALLAAMTYAGEGTASGYGKNFKYKRLTQSSGQIKLMVKPAIKAGLVRQSEADLVIGTALGEEARKCWSKALQAVTGNFLKRESRENIERIMSRAASLRCRTKEEDAIRLTGNPNILAGETYVKRIQALGRKYNLERAVKRQRAQARAAHNRASFRSSSSRPSSYIARGSSTSPGRTISSAEAYSASKRTVCASSTTKTSFCR